MRQKALDELELSINPRITFGSDWMPRHVILTIDDYNKILKAMLDLKSEIFWARQEIAELKKKSNEV